MSNNVEWKENKYPMMCNREHSAPESAQQGFCFFFFGLVSARTKNKVDPFKNHLSAGLSR